MKQQIHIAVFESDGVGPGIICPTIKIPGNMLEAGGYQFNFSDSGGTPTTQGAADAMMDFL